TTARKRLPVSGQLQSSPPQARNVGFQCSSPISCDRVESDPSTRLCLSDHERGSQPARLFVIPLRNAAHELRRPPPAAIPLRNQKTITKRSAGWHSAACLDLVKLATRASSARGELLLLADALPLPGQISPTVKGERYEKETARISCIGADLELDRIRHSAAES